MKKIIIILLLTLVIPLILAKEVTLYAGRGSTTYDGKNIILENVAGTGGAVVVNVDGVTETIPFLNTKIVNGIEITVVESSGHDNKAERFAILDIRKPGVLCFEDNFCDYKEYLNPSVGHEYTFRGKTIEVIDRTSHFLTLKVDGSETKIYSPFWIEINNEDPLKTTHIFNGIGLWNAEDDGDILRLGENFANCPSDCQLDNKDLIESFCKNNKKDIYTKEEDVDCGGLCERKCNQECVVDEDCERYDFCSNLDLPINTCYCENNKCNDIIYCEKDTDCTQVTYDVCGCELTSINKNYLNYWQTKLSKYIGTKGCANPCREIEYNSVCKSNICKLVKDVKEDEEEVTKTNIYELLDNIVGEGDFILVLGDEAPSTDSLAATDIATGIQSYSKGTVQLTAQLASEITNKNKMILIGHPCKNLLIDLSCENWPYKNGEALIKIDNSNLIIAGTTSDDTRKAAKIIAKYKDYLDLKKSNIILITESGLEIPKIIAGSRVGIEKTQEQNKTQETKAKVEEEKIETEEDIVKEEKKEHAPFTKRIWLWILSLFRK